jgi:predicted small lipoprotein YifL
MDSMKNGYVSKWVLVLSLLALAGCGKTDLYTTLPEKEANEIISLLAQQNIPAQKMEGTTEHPRTRSARRRRRVMSSLFRRKGRENGKAVYAVP